ncbi:MAG: hypothetical protein NT011_09990 [Kiritimatiellaeota bacterium]|nr:hypothetical protein [Kiritimatiellota bacterium]
MPHPQLDRDKLTIKPLGERKNKIVIKRDCVLPGMAPKTLSGEAREIVCQTADRMREARRAGRAIMLAFGAHTIKNGLAPVLIRLMEEGWLTHLATNGAGIIHDWEFAFQGQSGEDVRRYVAEGQFGIWQETGRYINLALIVGAYEGLGYGESVGALIQNECLVIPSAEELRRVATEALAADLSGDLSGEVRRCRMKTDPARAAAAADFLAAVRHFDLQPGPLAIPHPFKSYSVQAAAYRLNIPFTGHPMFGHDIIYNHPMNQGAAIGRTAQRDFLAFAHGVNNLAGGVYLSVGSAVMSPMIFEKAFAMAQNLHHQKGGGIKDHFILVVDLADARWDWSAQGEPPMDNPAYYLRYCKTFSRMGGAMRYLSADNRDFLLALSRELTGER